VPVASRSLAISPTSSGFEVFPAPAPVPAPTITSATSGGVSVVVNDGARTLHVAGSGLSTVQHLFLGLDRLTLTHVSDASLTATVPPFVPAGRRALVAVAANGATARFDGVTVLNSPAVKPAHVVFAGGGTGAGGVAIGASTPGAVVRPFASLGDLVDGVVSRDGQTLFFTRLFPGRVYAHNALPHPTYDQDELFADLGICTNAQQAVVNPAGTRMYVACFTSVAVLDLTVSPPAPIDTDMNPGTTDAGAPPGITNIDARVAGGEAAEARSLALHPNGQFLYVGRGRDPHVMLVNVSDDLVTAGDRTFYTLPGVAPGSVARTDGMAVTPDGSRLYASTLIGTVLRPFDIAAGGASLTGAGTVALPGAFPDIRRITILPDGRYMYVSSRFGASVHVFDMGAIPPAHVATLPTGRFSFASGATPDSAFALVAVAEDDSVVAIDARVGSPTLHQIVGTTGGPIATAALAVSPGASTAAGAGVLVQAAQGIDVTFSQVTSPGQTTVTSFANSDVPLPQGFAAIDGSLYYSIATTATFSGLATVCVAYDPAGLAPGDEASLRLLHQQGSAFVDVTMLPVDTANDRICGQVTGFSQFVVALATPPDPDLIFRNGFETSNLAAWSAASIDGGDLRAAGSAAIDGAYGLEAVVDDTAGIYVEDGSPVNEGQYRARFLFDTNEFDPGISNGRFRTRIFLGFASGPARLITIVLRRQAGGQYAVMGRVRRDNLTRANTGFFNITPGVHSVQFNWIRATAGASNGSFQLWIDDVLVSTITDIDNDALGIEFARLGAFSVKPGANGTLRYDRFESRRTGFIQP
jgi:hypothetical protein